MYQGLERGRSRNKEASQEVVVTATRVVIVRSTEKSIDSVYLLEAKWAGLDGGLGVEGKGERSVKGNSSKDLNNSTGSGAHPEIGSTEEGTEGGLYQDLWYTQFVWDTYDVSRWLPEARTKVTEIQKNICLFPKCPGGFPCFSQSDNNLSEQFCHVPKWLSVLFPPNNLETYFERAKQLRCSEYKVSALPWGKWPVQ